MIRPLLRGLGIAMALIAAWLWPKDRGIAVVFVLIAIGLWREARLRIHQPRRTHSRRHP